MPKIQDALQIAAAACRPASERQFAVAMGQLVGWIRRARLYRFSEDDAVAERQAAEITQDYRLTLDDLPADLLREGIVAVMRSYAPEYSVPPKPAQIRAPVAQALAERRDLLQRLKSAQFVATTIRRIEPAQQDPYRVERTPDEIAAVAAMTEQARQVLAAAQPQRVPGRDEDLKPERQDRQEAIRRVLTETQTMRRVPKPWVQQRQTMEPTP